jgi:chromosome segregation ATPase
MVIGEVSGQETLASIERALKQVSDDVDRLKAELDKTGKDKAELLAKRLDAFKDLAKFQTKLSLVDGVIDEADRLSAQVRTTLTARQKTIAALEAREAEANAEREELTARLDALRAEIASLESQLDAYGDQAREQLDSDKDYKARSDRYDELKGMAEKALEKARKSRDEEVRKGAPYRDDPLFSYLWERKFGTSNYDKTGIIRVLDQWVARLIGYQDARSNFAVLTQIPPRLEAHAERVRKLMEAEREQLDKVEAEKIRALAGKTFLSGLDAAHQKRETLTAGLERLNAELTETGQQLKTYAEGLDQSFRDAVEKTAGFLEGQSLTALRSEARNTPDAGDDEIVAAIGRLADERNALEELGKQKSEELDKAFRRKEELLRIAADFRRSGYDAPGSVFQPGRDGGTTQALLQLLLHGAITAVEYWARTQSNQRWEGRSGDSYRRSSRSSSSSRPSSRRSSSGGPDFRTGGGF